MSTAAKKHGKRENGLARLRKDLLRAMMRAGFPVLASDCFEALREIGEIVVKNTQSSSDDVQQLAANNSEIRRDAVNVLLAYRDVLDAFRQRETNPAWIEPAMIALRRSASLQERMAQKYHKKVRGRPTMAEKRRSAYFTARSRYEYECVQKGKECRPTAKVLSTYLPEWMQREGTKQAANEIAKWKVLAPYRHGGLLGKR